MTRNLNLVSFVSVDHMMKLVHVVGIERILVELADAIEEDFRRWQSFDQRGANDSVRLCRVRNRGFLGAPLRARTLAGLPDVRAARPPGQSDELRDLCGMLLRAGL